MAEVLGNKNVTHCRNFFINHRTRFNLVEVLAEYEKENNIPCDQSKLNDWSEEHVENEEMYPSQESEPGKNYTREREGGTNCTIAQNYQTVYLK